jgi:hypothetical protein
MGLPQRVALEDRHLFVVFGEPLAARRPPMLAPITTACLPRCAIASAPGSLLPAYSIRGTPLEVKPRFKLPAVRRGRAFPADRETAPPSRRY